MPQRTEVILNVHTDQKIENHSKHINKVIQQNVMQIPYSDLDQLLLQSP
jgi:hypothetical protein